MTFMLILSLSLGLPMAFNQKVEVASSHVHLRDVLTSDSYQLLRKNGFDNIRLAPSPNFRRSLVVNRNLVERKLNRENPAIDFDWKGPLATLVNRKSAAFPSKKLEEAVRQWVEENQPVEGTLHVDEIQLPRVNDFPFGDVAFRVQARQNTRMIGNITLYADVSVNGKPFRSLLVRVKTSLETLVAIPVINIARGTPISDDLIRWENRRLDRIQDQPLTPDQFEGVQARTQLRAGDIITARDVQAIPLVERNKPLFVIALSGNLKIRMQALALQTGARGEMIRVRNVDSGNMFLAKVTGPGEVTLNLNDQGNQF